MSQHKEQADIISHKKKQVDLVLEPIINQINNVEEEISEAYSGKQRALEFDEKLANADNSYERAMTHQACEDEFGEGSPRKIISKMESIIRRNERDLEKLHKRAHSIVEITVKTIEAKKLVIDGNNLCYESSNYFIGLEALLVVVPVLAEIYDVIVVFDASIRKALNCDDVEIHNKFGKNVNVHIVATKIKADETILDVASFDKTTLVISNDKYSDFSEKIAVAEQRVIRHEIVDGKIFIHALGVKICLGRNGQ